MSTIAIRDTFACALYQKCPLFLYVYDHWLFGQFVHKNWTYLSFKLDIWLEIMFTLYKVKIYFQKGCKRKDDSARVLSMLKIRINPSPSLSRNGLQSLHNSRCHSNPLLKNSPPAPLGFPPPPATTHSPNWSTPLGQVKFLSPSSRFTKLYLNARIQAFDIRTVA